ncbi:MAG: phosphoglycerate kinase, partial [Candidatus Komeilibacteria bacterium CG10_big_fil_rev_8_21_14_0_10_41_13]
VNCKRFAKKLAKLADYYVNEAFAVSHRKHSSLNAITKYLPAYAGLNLANEVLQLEKVLNSKVKPKVALIGGKKLTSKIGAVKNLLDKMDYVLLGGAAANNVLKAMDYEVGKSLIDKDSLPLAKRVLDNKLRMPIDVVVASSLKASAGSRVKAIGQLDSKDIILDIGPDTIQLYGEIIKEAKLVVWNGPLGYFEVKKYQQGSAKVAGQIAKAGSYSLAGGGETVQLIDELKLRTDFDFVSTGGGAMLEFLAGKILPGLRPLIK